MPVGVEQSAETTGAGANVALHEPMPNPFAGSVRIAFDLPRGGDASLRIYDVSGRRVRTLIESRLPAQIRHDLTWDGTDQDGRPVSTGIYFVRLEADGKSFTRRAVVLR
jgi:flagellar hook assembly protein FlgD